MNAYAEEYYSFNKYLLSKIGLWPYQSKAARVLVPCFIVALQFSIVVVEVLLFCDNSDDVDTIVEVIVNIGILGATFTKLINMIVNNGKFRRMLQLMNDHWSIFNSESELCILSHYADFGRRVAKCYAAYFVVIGILYLLTPLIPRLLDVVLPLNESRPLLFFFETEHRVDKEKYYYPILLHTGAATVVCFSILLSVDSMYIVCVLHACSLLKAVSHRIENIGRNDNEIDAAVRTSRRARRHPPMAQHDRAVDDYRELTACLRRHQITIAYVQEMNSTFLNAVLVLLILNILLLSIIGIQLINNLEHKMEVLRQTGVATAIFTHLTFLCFCGQLVIDRSAEVFDRAYNSRWHTFSVKSKTLLRMLLCRSLVPCTLKAGNMYVMSMSMCSSVMQTALSYFTTFLSIK